MNPWRWVDPRVRLVRVSDVQKYLLGRGWRLRESENPTTLVFEEPSAHGGKPFVQALPASEEFSDYPRHIAELITTLSEIEDRHPVGLLEDLLGQSSAKRAVRKESGRATTGAPESKIKKQSRPA